MKIITTPDGSRPIEGVECDDAQGRGSLVFFNQASLFQTAETNCASLKEAARKGVPTEANFGKDLTEAMEKYGVYHPLDSTEA